MMQFPIDKRLAHKAYRLSGKGLKGKAISEKLGKGITTTEANILASVGSFYAGIDEDRMTEREIDVLLVIAEIYRERLSRGETASPKAKHVAWRLRMSDAKLRTATRRLSVKEWTRKCGHFGFLEHSINGHIWLTAAGWAMVHVLEAAGANRHGRVSANGN